jgi:hypothetical protein
VLVALATTGETPRKMSDGTVKKLPPPATAFNAPASSAAPLTHRSSRSVIV